MARFERAPRDFGDLHATIDTTLLFMLNYSRTARIEHALTNLKFAILPLNYIPYSSIQIGFGKSIYISTINIWLMPILLLIHRAKRGSNPKSTDLQSVCSTILPPQPSALRFLISYKYKVLVGLVFLSLLTPLYCTRGGIILWII